MRDRETYLGDGLYASFDGQQIKLRAPRDGDHVVYLEPGVADQLMAFIRKTRQSFPTGEQHHDD